MHINEFGPEYFDQTVALFIKAFTDSEGEEEGTTVGQLVTDLVTTTEPQHLFGFNALSNNEVIAALFFSRLFTHSDKLAFLLAPVAVATQHQGQGVGQRLILQGIQQMKSRHVDWLFTYGDPAFYSKVGFQPIDENIVRAPQPLTYPHGWLAQSLNENPISPLNGATECVEAFNHPHYW